MPKQNLRQYNASWTMRPVLITCNMLGLSFYFVPKEKKRGRNFGILLASIASLFSFVYAMAFLALQSWFYIFWFRITFKDDWTPTLEARIRFAAQILYSALIFVNSSYSVALTKRFNELICEIDRCDKRLKGVKSYCKDQRMKLTYTIIFFAAISVAGQVKLMQMSEDDTFPMLFLVTIMNSLRICIFPLLGIQFVGLVGLIRRRIALVNDALSVFVEVSCKQSDTKIPRRKGVKVDDENKYFFDSKKPVAFLRRIRVMRKDLVAISLSANRAFGFILFCTVLATLMLVSVVTFLFLLELTNPTTGVSKIIHLGARSLCVMIGCIVIVYESAVTTKEAERTQNIIHRALLYNPSGKLTYELNQFIYQLLLEKVSFSAFKVFPLDQRLLYSMNGTVSMCFIILIQMEVSEMQVQKHQPLGN